MLRPRVTPLANHEPAGREALLGQSDGRDRRGVCARWWDGFVHRAGAPIVARMGEGSAAEGDHSGGGFERAMSRAVGLDRGANVRGGERRSMPTYLPPTFRA